MELKKLIMNRPNWLTSSEREGKEHIILSSEVSLSRNLKDFPFPNKLSIYQHSEVFNLVSDIIKSSPFYDNDTNTML